MRSALIFNFLIEANIMASIAILLMLPLRKLLRKKLGNTAICFGWLLVALRLLIPVTLPNPLIHEIRPAYLEDTIIRPIAGQVKVRVVDALFGLGRVFRQAGNRQAYADLQKAAIGVDYNGYPAVLAWIWLGGCALVLLWFAVRNARFRNALRKNRIEEISRQFDIDESCVGIHYRPVGSPNDECLIIMRVRVRLKDLSCDTDAARHCECLTMLQARIWP